MSEPAIEPAQSQRRAEIAEGLARVHARIAAATEAAGRSGEDVHLIVITKTFPARDVRLLADLGVTDVGENRDQEAAPKAQACADLAIRWHFVGQLQTNKVRSVVRYAHTIHSVDRPRLVTALSKAALSQERTVGCLVQVSLDDEPGRGGVLPDAVPGLADQVAGAPGLELRGVMAVAPLGGDPLAAFERLSAVAESVRRSHPAATWVSAGMSGDFEAAITCGATHVRVGSAILGQRPVTG